MKSFGRMSVWSLVPVSAVGAMTFTAATPLSAPPPPSPAIVVNSGGSIYVMNADGSNFTRVLANAGDYFLLTPAMSPDGSKIAFIGAPFGYGSNGLYTINTDGSGLTPLTATYEAFGSCAWSPVVAPDGRLKIAFEDYPSDDPSAISFEVILINTDGSGRKQLTFTDDAEERHVTWSPDAARIAVTYLLGENDCLVYDLGVDATGTVVVTGTMNITNVAGSPLAGRPDGEIQSPDWARYSDRIALAARGSRNFDVWIVDLANPSSPINLTDKIDKNADSDPAWSPDDGKLALWRGGAKSGIYTINADGTGLKQISRRGSNPDWKRVP